ncbi:lantibiotic immunity ABC transporter MutG family permease subunit [Streptococcus mutans]|uniref:lantibiotic immunity ABC transporter MutG family permease subunit n=1 Tax=Streptococcus mutans TaxID=1309 RepID=UPI0002B548BD|nr:lantibiotic immunity ABC transporter MutG family permease subunit [Streptococcus mutans]EMC15133.1 putative MutG [Streptococcus mutans N66]MCB4942735.1 lantibiotic immunity ABC transporter MutG family permease subunit [Streptococcus mutans]MCB5004154.1 lantibiotic immunity ABC transporter MutG family permease subunit [Streptococcus mutans]MCB5045294.1 lantibiotic immunity ABC transporter MutG family permease subunit [Streptococcus mutans]MCB5084019.1 lantibiotic immunity ABC transporter Mut
MVKLIWAEFLKYNRTFLPWIHVFLPVGIAVLTAVFGLVTPAYSWASITSGYLQMLGIAFPLVITVICSKAVELEAEAGHFQIVLASSQRKILYFVKFVSLIVMEIVAICLALAIFGLLYRSDADVPYLAFYAYVGLFLLASTVILYLLHLFIAFLFGSGATIGLGIFEVLVSALLLTGLGDGIWQFVPCAWPARLMETWFNMLQYPDQNPIFAQQLLLWLEVAFPMTLLGLFLSLLWFDRWQGRSNLE